MSAQVFRRLEKRRDLLRADPLLQPGELFRPRPCLDIASPDPMGLVHEEDEARNASVNSPVVLHLRDGDIRAFRDVTIAIREDANVDVRLIYHSYRHDGGVGWVSRQMLHR